MQQQLFSLPAMCLAISLVNFREGVSGNPDDDAHDDHARQPSVQKHSYQRADEHQRQRNEGVLIPDHGLVVEGSLHLVDHVSEGRAEDAGEDCNGCVFWHHVEAEDHDHDVGTTTAQTSQTRKARNETHQQASNGELEPRHYLGGFDAFPETIPHVVGQFAGQTHQKKRNKQSNPKSQSTLAAWSHPYFVNKIIKIMSKKLPSAPSIEACLEQFQRKEAEKEQYSKQQYLINLKSQCEIRENALRTAQSLISAYQKENQMLKEENSYLKDQIRQFQEKYQYFEDQSEEIKNMERSLLKYSQKISELLETNILNEQKIHTLEKELDKVRESQQGLLDCKAVKAKLKVKQEKQRKELEGQFKNYLRMPSRQASFYESVQKKKKEELGSDRKVLQWKLKQKDEEVLILLRRLKEMEERLDGLGRNRYPTYDSIDEASTKNSKKHNISQFEH